jgi:hypothetical protein
MYTTKVVSGSAAFSATNRGSVPPFLECPVKNLTLRKDYVLKIYYTPFINTCCIMDHKK